MPKLVAALTAVLIGLFCSTVMAATYSALNSMDTQVAKAKDTPYTITMTADSAAGLKVDGSKITILRDGDFYMSAAAQVGGSTTGDVYLWLRVNGKDVPDSNSVQTVSGPKFTAVLVSQTGISLKKGDVFELVYAATAPGLGIVATKPAHMPGVPSIIVSLFEL